MKIKLMFVTLFLVCSFPVFAQKQKPDIDSNVTAASETTQVPEADKAKVPAKGLKLPTIPDYLAPNDKALFSNSYKGDLTGVQAAIAKGASVNVADQKKRTALMLAASNGHTAVVEDLINEGANCNARDGDNQTALMYASKRSFNKTAAVLLKNGADVNVRSKKEGISALMLAAIWNNVELVNMFLDQGADAELKDVFGRTAEDLARKKGNSAVVEILSSSIKPEAGS